VLGIVILVVIDGQLRLPERRCETLNKGRHGKEGRSDLSPVKGGGHQCFGEARLTVVIVE
jgi:hypothetical protein